MLRLLRRLRARAWLLRQEVYVFYYAARHPATPWYAKLLVAAVAAYALSPIDLIPDFIPILGWLDDLVILSLGLALATYLVPPEVMAEAREKARHAARKRRRYFWIAVLIVFLWLAISAALAIWVVRRLFY